MIAMVARVSSSDRSPTSSGSWDGSSGLQVRIWARRPGLRICSVLSGMVLAASPALCQAREVAFVPQIERQTDMAYIAQSYTLPVQTPVRNVGKISRHAPAQESNPQILEFHEAVPYGPNMLPLQRVDL